MCSIKSVQFNDWLWRTSRDRNSTNQRSSPWLATGQYEMPTSVRSIDEERMHHPMWVTENNDRWACAVTYLCVHSESKILHSSWRDLDPIRGSSQVLILNDISIGLAVFVWLTRGGQVNKQARQTRQTDKPTYRPRYLFRDYACDAAEKRYHVAATTFCQGASSKSKLSVYCRYLSGRLWWGDVFRLESSSLRLRCSYIQTGIGSPAWCRVWCVV